MKDDERSERIENKIDTIIDKQGVQEVHLAEIRKDLQYHILRTNILEKKVYPVWLTYQVGLYLIGIVSLASAVYTVLEYYVK